MSEYVIRFFLGGIAVSAFAMGDDIQRPKSFAGLFSAAPSVVFATLGIAVFFGMEPATPPYKVAQ